MQVNPERECRSGVGDEYTIESGGGFAINARPGFDMWRKEKRRATVKMKKALLATVAAVAVVGFSALATAQNADQGKDATKSPGPAAQEQKATPGAGGAMMKSQGAQEQHPGQSAQGAQSTKPSTKPDERVGQDQQQGQQKGAQDERSTPQKGAQGSIPTKGAQDDNSKSGANANQKNANQSKGSRGASVQLSQDQRTKIQGVIGHDSSARVTTNVNFNVTVGTRVPSSVHVVVLPENVVEIVPQYEGFDYVIVGDNILIIDPDTMEIVDVIPV
jgi:Protein of unknown function (DUF1236)